MRTKVGGFQIWRQLGANVQELGVLVAKPKTTKDCERAANERRSYVLAIEEKGNGDGRTKVRWLRESNRNREKTESKEGSK